MRDATAELWEFHGRCPIVITTNGTITRAGLAVMGRGCAKEAALRFPSLRRELGSRLAQSGNRVYWWPAYQLFTFPVKHHWWEQADPTLIARSAEQLLDLVNQWLPHADQIVLPRPGCGNGRLRYDAVRPLLARILDDRFLVVTRSSNSPQRVPNATAFASSVHDDPAY